MRLSSDKMYHLIAPRPVAVITSLNSTDTPNAMVVSFISPVSFNPPILMISLAPVRHTYQNILKSGEFVVNILSKRYSRQILRCAAKYQEGADKVAQAGLRTITSKIVSAPRIKEAKIWIECKIRDSKLVGDHFAIFGEAVAIEVKDDVLKDGKVDMRKVDPMLHISKDDFAVDFKLMKYKR